ncbi:MAG: hypothetical protein ACRDQ0_21030 [Pseudonocardia sp.]
MIDYGSGAGRLDYDTPAQTYSVVPSKTGGVHAVLDGIIRNAFIDGTLGKGRLAAVCGGEVALTGRPPARNAVPHDGCMKALEKQSGRVERRPGPGSPLLYIAARCPVGDGSW